MATRTIYGQVESNGNVLAGTGFQSVRVGTGVYTIDFTQDFTSAPAVTVTPIGWDNKRNRVRLYLFAYSSKSQRLNIWGQSSEIDASLNNREWRQAIYQQ